MKNRKEASDRLLEALLFSIATLQEIKLFPFVIGVQISENFCETRFCDSREICLTQIRERNCVPIFGLRKNTMRLQNFVTILPFRLKVGAQPVSKP